jgi:hypothetical protein
MRKGFRYTFFRILTHFVDGVCEIRDRLQQLRNIIDGKRRIK